MRTVTRPTKNIATMKTLVSQRRNGLMQNMEANLKKAENSLRRLSERVGIEDEDVKNDMMKWKMQTS